MALRFEIKAIRSWTKKRLARDAAAAAPAVNGSPSGRDQLSAVLEAYDERFEDRAAARRTDAELHEEFRVEAARLLDTVITPALREIGREISEHGHQWKVEARVDILGQPAVACAFSPRETLESGRGASELSFRFHFPDRLAVSGAAHDGSELQELPPRSYEVESLDTSLVRKEVTRFVSTILEYD